MPENAMSIFDGRWASHVPGVGGGEALLFEDYRLIEIIQLCGGLSGKKCLELRPLEGGHTYTMWRNGAQSILSIEANQRAFLKCLITKEIVGYEANFLLGDFAKFAETTTQRFDFTNMSGVLYHIPAPHELIANVARISDQIACWTHYFDKDILKASSSLSYKFEFKPKCVNFSGIKIELFKQNYLDGLELPDYCGGKDEFSHWLKKSDILALFNQLGFDTHVLSDDPEHCNGPCMSFYAVRKQNL